jgi:hypothetical protein
MLYQPSLQFRATRQKASALLPIEHIPLSPRLSTHAPADQVELPTGSLRSTSGLLIGAYKSILAKKPKHFQSSVFAGAFFSIPIDSSLPAADQSPTKYCANYLCESLLFSNFIAKTGIYP